MINFKNLNSSWLKEQIRGKCKIKLVSKDELVDVSCCYQRVFNGAPFFESWTFNEAKDVISEYYFSGNNIWIPKINDEVVGFLVTTDSVPEDQVDYVKPYPLEEMQFIEEIGVKEEWRSLNIASELLRFEIRKVLQQDKRYLGYRTNAMRYFEGDLAKNIEQIQLDDRDKRRNGESIKVPSFSDREKQEFINLYIRLLSKRPDLDVSDSSKLFRGLGMRVEYSIDSNGNYTWQIDPTGEVNDRVFPVVDLRKSGYTKTYYNSGGQR